jgi:hypothetical protein
MHADEYRARDVGVQRRVRGRHAGNHTALLNTAKRQRLSAAVDVVYG